MYIQITPTNPATLKRNIMTSKIEVIVHDDELVIAIAGEFNFTVSRLFHSFYLDTKYIAYTIDMRKTNPIDSSALGMLLQMREYLGGNTAISIITTLPDIKKTFALCHFDKKFNIRNI